jgi:hypothetical protein
MFARYLLCVLCLIVLISCGAENVVVEDEFPDDGSGVPDTVSPDSYSGDVPTVILVIDGLWDDVNTLSFECHLEVDRPPAHDLFVYLEANGMYEDRLPVTWDYGGKFLMYVPAGNANPWTYRFWHDSAFLFMMRILPANMRHDIKLPISTAYGRDKAVPSSEKNVEGPSSDHQFKPYRIGDPSQIVRKLDEIDRVDADLY